MMALIRSSNGKSIRGSARGYAAEDGLAPADDTASRFCGARDPVRRDVSPVAGFMSPRVAAAYCWVLSTTLSRACQRAIWRPRDARELAHGSGVLYDCRRVVARNGMERAMIFT